MREEAEDEKEGEKPSLLSGESDVGLDLMALRSRPELQSRAGRFTGLPGAPAGICKHPAECPQSRESDQRNPPRMTAHEAPCVRNEAHLFSSRSPR